MTPLERAARAIATEIGVDPDQLITADDDAHVGLGLRGPHPAWTRYVGTARAALQAVREPSEHMLLAAQIGDAWNAEDPEGVWQAMVDAALEDE
jgi:hypothetical protein